MTRLIVRGLCFQKSHVDYQSILLSFGNWSVSSEAPLSKSEHQNLHTQVQQIIDALPQRNQIDDKVAQWWIAEVIKREGKRAIWHAYRAGTIGGSEAGEFILHATGRSNAYQNLEDIWKSKMLLSLPQRPTLPMRRGTAMEDLANQVYLKLTGHTSVLNTPMIQDAFSKPHKDFVHIGGNPDEVVDAGKSRLITDFKVRSNLDEESGISIVNGSQLHWYGLLHQGNLNNSLPDAYALAELDIPNQMIDDLMRNPPDDWRSLAEEIASINRPGFGMRISYTKHNPRLAKHLVELTQTFWNKYVMTGTPFVMPKPERPGNLTDGDEAIITATQNDFLTYKLAENVAKEQAVAARERLIEVAEKYKLEEWPFEKKGLSSGYSKKFVAEAAATRLIAKGVDRNALLKPGNPESGKPNVEAMIQTLKNHGLLGESHFEPEWNTRAIKAALKEREWPASDFETQTFRVGLTKKKADLPTLELLQDKMQSHIGNFMVAPKSTTDDAIVQTNDSLDDLPLEDSLKLA